MLRKPLIVATTLLTAAGLFVAGMLSHARHWEPTAILQQWRGQLRDLGLWPATDLQIRKDFAWRRRIACPTASGKTMVALIIGQSQAANSVGERFVGARGVVNVFRRRCYEAMDPLLGTTHDFGNLWTFVGNELVARHVFDNVVLIMGAVGGSRIAEWAPGGRLSDHLLRRARDVPEGLSITHVIIQQGEADRLAGTSRERYRENLTGVMAALRREGIAAPIFVAIESRFCEEPGRLPDYSNPVALAQRDVVAQESAAFAGADMDRIAASRGDRYDGCHLSGAGARKLGEAWIAILRNNEEHLGKARESQAR